MILGIKKTGKPSYDQLDDEYEEREGKLDEDQTV